MTKVRVEDLPPKLRAQVLAADGGMQRAKRTSPGPAGATPPAAGSGPRYRCGTCQTEFDHYGAAAERCADAHHGARLEALL